tara:strand:- start:14 stop:364 length:351 start_codon:yes stop_codon:yes gene_type:complete
MSKLHSYKGVDYEPKNVNGELIELTDAECEVLLQQTTAWNNKSAERKLVEIKRLRLQKLIETDYLANSDVTMPDNIKTWRQSLRDIPANHTDENAYDLLLARDSDGKLTHSIWSKP